MAANTLDQTSDNNRIDLYRYSRLYGLPAYVKQAEEGNTCSPEKLPTAAYADVRVPHQFPCHTKAATYLSWMFFLDKQARLPESETTKIASKLDMFAESWGIKPDIDKLKQKHQETKRASLEALPDSDFAYVWQDEDGNKERKYPLRNAAEVKAAADWLVTYRDHFTFGDRHTLATKILDKAAAYGASLGENTATVERQAGNGFCHPKQAASLVRNRLLLRARAPGDVANKLEKLAATVESMPEMAMSDSTLFKLAETVDQFDRMIHLEYSDLLPRVEDVLYRVRHTEINNFKAASCELISGSVYTSEQFNKLALSDVRDFFGDDVADEVADGLKIDCEKMAEIAKTLPRPDADLLDRLMASAGEGPVHKEARDRGRLGVAELHKLAELYTGTGSTVAGSMLHNS